MKSFYQFLHEVNNQQPANNPLVHAAAQFLHKELGPLTSQTDKSGKSVDNHPSHYANKLHTVLKDPMTTDVKTIVDAAHEHIVGGHHNMGDWSYDNLPPEKTINYDDVDRIAEDGEEEIADRLTHHLHGIRTQTS